jgi:hypothetical protein
MNNCSDCINSKMIRSKGGFKYICKLQTEKEVRWCLAHKKKSFIPKPKEEE